MWKYQRSVILTRLQEARKSEKREQLELLEFWFGSPMSQDFVGWDLKVSGLRQQLWPVGFVVVLVNNWIGSEQMTNGHGVGKEGSDKL